jgi:hypothetical protein
LEPTDYTNDNWMTLSCEHNYWGPMARVSDAHRRHSQHQQQEEEEQPGKKIKIIFC